MNQNITKFVKNSFFFLVAAVLTLAVDAAAHSKINKKCKFLIKPVKEKRVSSLYGYRIHPILKTKKLHKGIDFAAPHGTPIIAAADGIIDIIGPRGSFGNYIRIKHDSQFHTAYAHTQKFAKGLKKGSKVKKGQVIAYVGTTGRSTGPHLHFELHKNDKHVNPIDYVSL